MPPAPRPPPRAPGRCLAEPAGRHTVGAVGLLAALLDVMVPVLVVAGIGALLGRRFTLDQATIGKIALNALTPALCLHTLLTTRVSGREGAHLLGAYLVVVVLACGVGFLSSLGMPGRTRRGVMVATAIGNNGNMGLPIALFALGPIGLDQSVLIFLGSVIVTFVLAPALFGSADGARGAARAVLRLPAIWAMAAALVLRAGGWQLPTGIARGVELLSQATLPMILLALGVQLGSSQRVVVTRPIAAAVAGRILVVPALALGVGLALGLAALPLQALVLAAAMPTAVNAFILAQEYEGDVPTVAGSVTVSTLVSFATVAVVTALLPWVGSLA